jgi:hypothetical protein
MRKHYMKWSAGRQARITTLLHKVAAPAAAIGRTPSALAK